MTKKLQLASSRTARSPFAAVEDALEAIRAGQMIIVVDDEDRATASHVGCAFHGLVSRPLLT